jgi:hypothetical protein
MSVTPGNDPFSGSNTRNILQHIISPKIVDTGSGAHAVKLDLINVDNAYISGRFYDTDGQVRSGTDLTSMDNRRIVVVGDNNTSAAILYSDDNTSTWQSATLPITTGSLSNVWWSGDKWVAVGRNSDSSVCILVSDDGITWVSSTTNPFATGRCFSVKYNGQYWVAVGSDSATLVGSTGIAYSEDALTWTAITGNPANPFFGGTGRDVDWNGTLWVAVGKNLSSPTVAIAYSYDGRTWTSAGNPLDAQGAVSVKWNGQYWIVGGTSLVTSRDAITWTAITANPFSGGACMSLDWNGTTWLAGGYNSVPNGVLAYSTDGQTWTTVATHPLDVEVIRVRWDSDKWIAAGYNSSNTIVLIKSTNLTTWTTITTSGITSAAGVATTTPFWVTIPSSNELAIKKILMKLFQLNGNTPI